VSSPTRNHGRLGTVYCNYSGCIAIEYSGLGAQISGVEEAVLHWSGKSVKAVKHTQLSTFIYSNLFL